MIFSLLAIAFGSALFLLLINKKRQKIDHLSKLSNTEQVDDMVSQSVIDLSLLTRENWLKRCQRSFTNFKVQLGNKPIFKITSYFIFLMLLAWLTNTVFIQQNLFVVIIFAWLIGGYIGLQWLSNRAKRIFEDAFPDALNMMVSSVSAGESLLHSIIFVGSKLDTVVGREFKSMGQRIQIGEPVDDVLRQSCLRLPYPSFQFFVITLRANINRGGQLKDVIAKISRLLFDSRALEQKKMTMTAEARASAKIVCAIPFAFLLLMRFLMPENYQFVMEHESGKGVLYYLLISEALGMGLIYSLLKSVK